MNSVESVNGDERFAALPSRHRSVWNFASPGDTEMRLRAAGFDAIRCWLEDRPVQPREPRGFLEAVVSGRTSDRLPEDLRGPYLDAVLEVVPRPLTLDYVRLNISAHRS